MRRERSEFSVALPPFVQNEPEKKMNKSNGYLIFLTLVATLGGLLFGYDTAVISGTVKYLDLNFVVPLGLDETAASSLLGFAVSSALIGCVIGGLIGGVMATRLGRKRSLMAAAVLLSFRPSGRPIPKWDSATAIRTSSCPISSSTGSSAVSGVGLASMLSPMYIAEMAPAGRRGSLVSWNQFAIIFGMLVVYFVNYGIALSGDEQWLTTTGWRLMFLSEVIPASCLLLLIFCVPESPRWLVMKGQDRRAAAILRRVDPATDTDAEVRDIRRSLAGSVRSKFVQLRRRRDRDRRPALRIPAVRGDQRGAVLRSGDFPQYGHGYQRGPGPDDYRRRD